MTNHLIQAYRQAPWRVQLQWIGLFLLALVLVASVASIYLNVSASAAAAGREIQSLEYDKTVVEQSIADLETQLALLTSAAEMEKRAKSMGFQPPAPETVMYIVVPEYAGRQPVVMAPPPGPQVRAQQPLLRPSYTQSLLEWLFQGFISNPLSIQQVQP